MIANRWAIGATGAIATVIGIGTPAAARDATNIFFRPTVARGTIDVKFASDARCGITGRCGIAGTERYTTAVKAGDLSLANLATSGRGNHRRSSGEILIASGSSTASVTLGTPPGNPCVDSLGRVPVAFAAQSSSARRVEVRLAKLDIADSPDAFLGFGGLDPFDMRCPGPRLADLDGIKTPLASIPVNRFHDTTVRLTLKSGASFDAGGFEGTMTTTIQLKLRRIRVPPDFTIPSDK